MVTSKQCIDKWGDPSSFNEGTFMTLWNVDPNITACLPVIPKRIYINKDALKPLENALNNIIDRGICDQLKSWDGCFNIRNKRGGTSWSLHSWGIAVDINAATNQLGQEPTMGAALVKCFTDAGFQWGGNWTRKDGMHFQLKNI